MTIVGRFTQLERKLCLFRLGESTLLCIILFSITLSACQQSYQPVSGSKRPEKKLKVLTTTASLYSFTKNITGDLAVVENLLPSGAGPHEYSFSPSDIKKIKEAQVLIKNGANLETWLDKLVASAEEGVIASGSKKLTVVDTSAGVEVILNDPHIWLSPRNAIIQVKNIRDALVKEDPGRTENYTENAEKYINRLEVLDRDLRDEVKTWDKKEFVAFHPAFQYFARDYGLRLLAVIQESPEEEPTSKHIAYVIKTIKAKGIKAIFSESQFTPKIVKAIAGDLKLRVYPLDTLESGMLYPEWYEDRMRANVAVLKKALH